MCSLMYSCTRHGFRRERCCAGLLVLNEPDDERLVPFKKFVQPYGIHLTAGAESDNLIGVG